MAARKMCRAVRSLLAVRNSFAFSRHMASWRLCRCNLTTEIEPQMLHAPSLNCVLTLATLGVHRRCTRWICYRARRDRPWSSWERQFARRRRSLMKRRNEWQRWRLSWRVAAQWLQIVNSHPRWQLEAEFRVFARGCARPCAAQRRCTFKHHQQFTDTRLYTLLLAVLCM